MKTLAMDYFGETRGSERQRDGGDGRRRCGFISKFFSAKALSRWIFTASPTRTSSIPSMMKTPTDACEYSGFSITQEMLLQLNEDMVKSFYEEHAAKRFFSSLVQYMTGGPVLIMVLEKTNAVVDWRSMI